MAEQWIEAKPDMTGFVEAKPKQSNIEAWTSALIPIPAMALGGLQTARAGVKYLAGETEEASRIMGDVGAVSRYIAEQYPVEGAWPEAGRGAGVSILTQALPMLAGWMTGNPMVALNAMGTVAGLQKVAELSAGGVEMWKALPLGVLSGVVEKYTELIPFETFIGILKKNKTLAANLTKMMLFEQGGEQLANMSDQVIDLVKPGTNWSWSDYKRSAADTARATLLQTAAMGAGAAGAARIVTPTTPTEKRPSGAGRKFEVAEPTGKRKEVIEARKIAKVAEQLELGFVEAPAAAAPVVAAQAELFTEAPAVTPEVAPVTATKKPIEFVQERSMVDTKAFSIGDTINFGGGVSGKIIGKGKGYILVEGPEKLYRISATIEIPFVVEEAVPFGKTIAKVEALTPDELITLQRMGYSIKKSDLKERTPDEWRLTMKETEQRTHTPEEIAAATAAQAGLARMEQERVAASDTLINRVEELGIADRRLTVDADRTVRDLRPEEMKVVVDAIDGKTPVSKRHAQARTVLERVMKKIEEVEARIETGELDAHIPDEALARLTSDLAVVDRLAKMSDTELDTFFKEKVILPGREAPSEFLDFAARERARLTDLTEEQLDAEITGLLEAAPVRPAVPEPGKIAPFGGPIQELLAVEQGRKRLSTVDKGLATFQRQYNDPRFAKETVGNEVVFYLREKEEEVKPLVQRLRELKDVEVGPEKIRELGRIFDYSERDIELFLSRGVEQVAAKIAAPVVAEAPAVVTGKERVARARAAKPTVESAKEVWSKEAEDLTYEISDKMGISFEEAKSRVQAAVKAVPEANLTEALKMVRDRFGVAEEATLPVQDLRAKIDASRDRFKEVFVTKTREVGDPVDRLVIANRYLPEDVGSFRFLNKKIREAEADFARAGRTPDYFSRTTLRQEIERAAEDQGYTPRQVEIMRATAEALIDSLKNKPTFGIYAMARDPESTTTGIYTLARNVIGIRDPGAFAHEVGHFAYWNVLTSADRASFRDILKEKYYTKGKLDLKKLRADASRTEGMYNPSEIFASRFSDFVHERVLTPTEISLVRKSIDWFREVIDKLRRKTRHDFSDVEELFNKIVDSTGERKQWTGKVGGVVEVATPDVYNWRQGRLGRMAEAAVREGVTEEQAAAYQGSYTLDSMGMQQTYEGIRDWIKRVRTIKDGPTTTIVKELQGENGPQVLYKTDKPVDVKRWSEWTMSPLQLFRKDPIGEKKVFDLMSATQYAQWATHQHYSALRNIQDGLTEGERVNVRQVLEGKVPGNPMEQKAAADTRAWLDAMRAKYQDHLRTEFKKNMTPEENEIVSRLIAKEDFLTVNLRANKLKVDIAVAWDLAKKYKDVDKWGLDDYITKVELGKWKILDEKKNVVAVAMSEQQAIKKATDYMEENPTASKLYLDDSFIAFGDDVKGLSRKQYWSIVNKLQKGIQDNVDGLNAGIAKHLAQKAVGRQFIVEPTKVWSPFTQPRRDVLKGEEDIFPVLFSYARSMEKKMNLDPVLDDIRKVAQMMPPNKQRALINLAEDVKGKYYIEDQIADDIMKWFKIDAQSKAASRAVGDIKSFEAQLKLGYRPVAATVNLLSGQAHTWVKTGNEYYAKGVRFLNTEEGKAFIKQEEPYFGVNVVEDALGTIRSEAEWYHPLGLFQAVEPINRKVSLAANYVMAREKFNMSHDAAREFARKANWFQQFTYDIASLPKIMRSPLGRLMTQFKPYLVKEIEFARGLKGMEVGRYVAAQLALGGPRGAMIVLKSLPILGALGLLDDIEEWMNKEWPRVSRGVGGAIGVDVTAPATIQFPSGAADLTGPFFSDVGRFMKDLPTLYTNIIRPALTGGDVEKDLPDLRNTLGRIVVAAKYWNRLIDQMVDKDGWVRDDKGAKIYQLPETTADRAAFAGKMVAGAEDIEVSKQTLAARLEERDRKRHEEQATMTVNRALRILRARGELSEEIAAELRTLGVSGKSVKNTAIWREMTPQQRAVVRAQLIRRGAVLEGWPVTGEYD